MNVESFNLDHRAEQHPYVRIADRKVLPGGDTLISTISASPSRTPRIWKCPLYTPSST